MLQTNADVQSQITITTSKSYGYHTLYLLYLWRYEYMYLQLYEHRLVGTTASVPNPNGRRQWTPLKPWIPQPSEYNHHLMGTNSDAVLGGRHICRCGNLGTRQMSLFTRTVMNVDWTMCETGMEVKTAPLKPWLPQPSEYNPNNDALIGATACTSSRYICRYGNLSTTQMYLFTRTFMDLDGTMYKTQMDVKASPLKPYLNPARLPLPNGHKQQRPYGHGNLIWKP